MALFLPHFNLQKHNTLAVPAIASWYVSVNTEPELHEAVAFARERRLPLLILGGGSNLVLRGDFPGLVVHLRILGKTLVRETSDAVWLKVAAGENWDELVRFCVLHGYYGLENLGLIPGSVGAAPIQNIGAYGVEVKEFIAELTAYELMSGLSVTFTGESCEFGYRDSIFKNSLRDKYAITSVTFRLERCFRPVASYPALRDRLGNNPEALTAEQVYDAVVAIRCEKLPDPAQVPNVGSFFKNPVLSAAEFESLKSRFPDIVSYTMGDRVKLAAAWLIDRAGWRGKNVAGARVHDKQALVLTNPERASGQCVLALADEIVISVKAMFGVELEMEPRVYP